MWPDHPDHSIALGRNWHSHVAAVALRMGWLQHLKGVVRQENAAQWLEHGTVASGVSEEAEKMTRISRRGYLGGAAVMLSGVLAAACGEPTVRYVGKPQAGPPGPAGPQGLKGETGARGVQGAQGAAGEAGMVPVTITWGTGGRQDLAELFQSAIDLYHDQQQAVRVELEVTQPGFAKKLATQIAAGTPPNVIRSGEAAVLSRVPGGAIAAIDSYVSQTKYDLTAFYDSTVQAYEWKGKLYGLPWIALTGMIWSNVAHFNSAGESLPKDTWTWDEMLETARRVTRGDEGSAERIFGIGLTEWWEFHLLPMIRSWGGQLFDNDVDPTMMMVDPAAVDALQWYAELYTKHRLAPTAADRGELSSVRFFYAGRDAMFMSAVQVQDMRTRAKFEFDIHKLPAGKAGFASGSTTGGFAVMQGAPNIPEGFDFISFLAGEAGQRALMGFGAQIPAYRGVAESADWVGSHPPKNRAASIETLKVAQPAPRGPFWSAAKAAIRKAYAPVLAGKETARQALEATKPKVDTIIQKYL